MTADPWQDEPADDFVPYADRIRARLVDTAGLRALPPPAPLIDRWLDLDSLAVIYGASGAGKSHVVVDLAAHIAAGRQWWNSYGVTNTGVLYVLAEGLAGMSRRVDAWAQHHGIEPAITWHPGPINVFDYAWAGALAEVVADLRPGWVIIDTYARSTTGADENSTRDTGVVVDNLDVIRRSAGCNVTVVHHTGKDTSKGGRGSSALRAAVETEIEVVGSEGRVTVKATKRRDSAEPAPLHFQLTAVGESVVLNPVGGVGFAGGTPAIEEAATAAVKVCVEEAAPISLRRLAEKMGEHVKVRRETRYAGIEEAAARGHIREFRGDRQARMFEVAA